MSPSNRPPVPLDPFAQGKIRRPILIDTDLSFDDYIALLFLLQHPAVEVRALTVADNGVAHARLGLENAARLLRLVRQEEVPVACGPAQSLSGSSEFPASWRLLVDYSPRLWLPRRKAPPASGDAPTLIRQQILASPVPVTFVALAPLTNLALALRADPDLVQHIGTVVVSGGAFTVPGTIQRDLPNHPNAVAEWNFYTDPLAARLVLQSGAQIALAPLDVTDVKGASPLVFSRPTVRALRSAARGEASRLLARFLHMWQLATTQFPVTPVWDAAVAALVVDPQLGSWREMKVDVAQEPKAIAGQTYESAEGHSIQVCYAGNQPAFEATYLKLVAGNLNEPAGAERAQSMPGSG